ncbi:MAG: nitrogen fixation protein NifM [Rhodocyclales bacterium GWA2_65_20]|nr:MAG: nitrogen fixation protein NifM [Rhodocyclales bacterium GWA2_65_20]
MPESHPYLTLKLAQELFHKPPGNLEPAERQRVDKVVARQLQIERRILATPEAAQVVLPASSLDQTVAEIRNRYPTEEEYRADLEKSGLDPARLAAAIGRDLKVDAVLDRVASLAAAVGDTDVEIFYLMQRERFRRPENRTLRHILVTINDSLPGSERAAARTKIDAIRARLLKSPGRFAEQALKHSECPTAMNGGLLGTLKRGQLYPELEPAAFALAPGELSQVVESPLGFHIIHCVAVEAACEVPLATVREKIRAHLADSRRRASQKAWIAGLFGQELR